MPRQRKILHFQKDQTKGSLPKELKIDGSKFYFNRPNMEHYTKCVWAYGMDNRGIRWRVSVGGWPPGNRPQQGLAHLSIDEENSPTHIEELPKNCLRLDDLQFAQLILKRTKRWWESNSIRLAHLL